MRKLALIISVIVLVGCATAPQKSDWVPPDIYQKRADRIFNTLYSCMDFPGSGKQVRLFIIPGRQPNARVDQDGNIFFNHSNFMYSDIAIAWTLAHEMAHIKLDHIETTKVVSYTTTTVMMVANVLVPGVGILNHIVNPAVTNNFSKTQEYDADVLASQTLVKCFGVPIERQIKFLEPTFNPKDGGGFWSTHPVWTDRMANIRTKTGTTPPADN